MAKPRYKPILFGLVVVLGIVAGQLGWFDWRLFVAQGERYAHLWWFIPALIAAKVVLYTFALPGSTLIWVAGLFYQPLTATAIIVAGGTLGALAAYGLCRWLAGKGGGSPAKPARVLRFLYSNSDWGTLLAVRTLPNFPHSVINYGAGVLAVPLPRFLIATAVGFTIKGFLYALMIRNAATADTIAEAIDLQTLGPLFVLAALFLAGPALQRRFQASRRSGGTQ
ncbi:TVP38/TMEM64 family protein [Desulfatitalea alkaliphila]|uniref:VTT domain-containing protein n=1 Tax=Desulfatitalea alkaliphila TaxID=2929485 RepID=A0AA41R3Y8_9BACT|nr:VTT domain-containing protein [Desulfatitalea alkaliphila]MCJ8501201.1 VTT domain-containing protein [Desulfatitalea alkaliphila]